MEIKYSADYPERTTKMGTRRTFNYNIRKMTESELQELWTKEENQGISYNYFVNQHKYVYNTLIIGGAKWKYDEVVSAIIRDKYREDEMEAITNNMNAVVSGFMYTLINDGITDAIKYLKENRNSEDSEKYEEMQKWRTLAKIEAKSIFKNKL